MKIKRLLCLLLSLLMLAGVFLTACSEKEDEEALSGITDAASESTITLAVHLMSETDLYVEEKDEEGNTFTQAQRIEEAVNKITKSQFKTQLNLYFYEADEYYEKLEAKFAARKEAERTGEVYKKDTAETSEGETAEETEAETIVGEDGITELVYPTIKDYQVDIFYFAGYEKFSQYMAAGNLTRMDKYFTNTAMLITDYLAPGFITYMNEMNGGTYALPTGKVIGEYTYMLLNKEVLEEANYYSPKEEKFDATGFTSLVDENVADLLSYTSKHLSDKYVPLSSETGELDVLGYKYWGIDKDGNLSDDFSVMGGNYDVSLNYKQKGATSEVANLLANKNFQADVLTLKSYVNNGYYGEEDNEKPFAVGYVKGGAELEEIYGDKYIMIPVEMPRLETEDLYENMFGVTNYTSDPSRSMEILTYLNTNTEIRNLLLYGIEDKNYKMVNSKYKDANGEVYLDENEKPYRVISPLEESNYKMDKFKTGNTLIVTPTENDLPIIKDYATKQNRESLVSQDMTFMLPADVEMEKLEDIRELSAEVYEELIEILNDKEKTAEDLEKFLTEKAKEVDENESFKFHVNDKNKKGLAAIYNSWCITKSL